MAEYTDEQVGKRVVAQSGEEIGEVVAIDEGSLVVEVQVGDGHDVVDHLGWDSGANQERHTLDDRYVSTIRENAVRLRV
ncbi:hypothetical protein [Halosimplex salinum]|uniref:hypothetical protein n=1 Tax=Halosimplex salinum TaxID=1710538 RepID=UPI000F48F255|nr:hypothetical protein [Halosimplex salinum]